MRRLIAGMRNPKGLILGTVEHQSHLDAATTGAKCRVSACIDLPMRRGPKTTALNGKPSGLNPTPRNNASPGQLFRRGTAFANLNFQATDLFRAG